MRQRRQHTSSSGSDTTASSGSFSTITDGTLLVGTDAPYPPFEIGTPADGDFGGFDIDLMNAIADKLGLDARRTRTARSTRSSVTWRAASSTSSPRRRRSPRAARRRSTSPTRTTRPSRRWSSPEGSDITSTDDLAGKIVGAQQGTTGETYAKDETDAAEVRGFRQGRRRARGGDHRAGRRGDHRPARSRPTPSRSRAGIEIVEEIPTNELYGFAIAPDNPLIDGASTRRSAS